MNWQQLCKFCFCIIVGIFIGYLIFHTKEQPSVPFVPDYKEEVIKKDSIVRDSLYQENDSIETEISNIEKEYNAEISHILSSSDSINLCFFSEYIEHYNNKRAASDN